MSSLSKSLGLISLSLLLSLQVFAQSPYPTTPDPVLTPGELCSHPDSYRYPERIKYCERDVEVGLKRHVIDTYDKSRGYQVSQMSRKKFKIDHYIPLCMGGANTRDNLWPQHESLYKKTDFVENLACDKMAQGRLKQADAVELIKAVKNNQVRADESIAHLNSL